LGASQGLFSGPISLSREQSSNLLSRVGGRVGVPSVCNTSLTSTFRIQKIFCKPGIVNRSKQPKGQDAGKIIHKMKDIDSRLLHISSPDIRDVPPIAATEKNKPKN